MSNPNVKSKVHEACRGAYAQGGTCMEGSSDDPSRGAQKPAKWTRSGEGKPSKGVVGGEPAKNEKN